MRNMLKTYILIKLIIFNNRYNFSDISSVQKINIQLKLYANISSTLCYLIICLDIQLIP